MGIGVGIQCTKGIGCTACDPIAGQLGVEKQSDHGTHSEHQYESHEKATVALEYMIFELGHSHAVWKLPDADAIEKENAEITRLSSRFRQAPNRPGRWKSSRPPGQRPMLRKKCLQFSEKTNIFHSPSPDSQRFEKVIQSHKQELMRWGNSKR